MFNYERMMGLYSAIRRRYSYVILQQNVTYPLKVTSPDLGLHSQIKHIGEFRRYVDKNMHESLTQTGSYYVLHSPFEWPSKFSFQFQSKALVAIQLLLTPQISSIDDNLINSSPKERNCYIRSEDQREKALKYFKLYTKNNCLVECLANQTLSECGCVQFFMLSKFQSCGIKEC